MQQQLRKLILKCALGFALAVIVFVAFVICRYHPTGIMNDERGQIVLTTFIGEGDYIPTDSIRIITMPVNTMKGLFKTNGANYGKVKYGHFTNSDGVKMFLYLTGQKDTVCFKYKNLLYVTDDWRKVPMVKK